MTTRSAATSIRWNRWLTAIFITVICVGAALGFVDLGDSVGALATLKPSAWFGVISFSLLMAALRAARVVMVARGGPVAPLVKASFLHGAATAILPARTGEAVLPLALARYGGMDPMRAIGLLLLVRIGDLIALVGLSLLLVAAFDWWGYSDGLRVLLAAGGAALVLAVGAVPSLIQGVCGFAPHRLRSILGRVAAAGAHFRLGSRITLIVLTLAIWLALALAARVSVEATGLQLGIVPIWLASAAASLAFAMPTNGIASIGPFEAAFVGVLVAAGASAEAALTAAVHLHLCALLAACLAALAALAFPTPRPEPV